MIELETEQTVSSDPKFYSAFPSAIGLSYGRTLVAFRRAPDDRELLATLGRPRPTNHSEMSHLHPRSEIVTLLLDEEGRPLGPPRRVGSDAECSDQDASLFARRNGGLGLLTFQFYPVLPPTRRAIDMGIEIGGTAAMTGLYFVLRGAAARLSDDGGESWSPPKLLGPLPDSAFGRLGDRRMYGGALRGRTVTLADGTLGVATYVADGGRRPWYDCHFHVSTDDGETWSYRSTIARGEKDKIGLAEPSLLRLPSGRIIAFIRTIGYGDHVVAASSSDGGEHWEPWRDLGWTGHPVDPLLLPDGRLLLAYARRADNGSLCLRLIERPDDALDSGIETVVSRYPWGRDAGYPSLVATGVPGRFHVLHYRTEEDGIRSIVCTTVRMS